LNIADTSVCLINTPVHITINTAAWNDGTDTRTITELNASQ